MAAYWQIVRSFSPSLQRFLISLAIFMLADFGILAVLQNLYLLRLGFDVKFIGLIWSLGTLVWAIAALPAGLVSSRLGLRNAIVVGQAFYVLAVGLMLLVEGRPEQLWPLWLMGCQALMMVGAALISVSISPYLMVLTGEEERRHAFAVVSAIIPAMSFAGSLIAGLLPALFVTLFGMGLAQATPFRLALWIVPLLLLLSMLPLWAVDAGKTTQVVQDVTGEPAPVRLLAFFGLLVYLLAIGEGVVRTFFNVHLDAGLAVSSAQIGAIMGFAQLLPVVVALSAPILISRWGTGYALALTGLGVAATLLLLAFAPGVWMVALAYMGVISTVTLMSTTRDLWGQELVTARWRTTSSAVAMIGLALGWSTAGFVGGYLIDALGYGVLYFAGAASALLAVILLATYLRAQRAPGRLPAPTQAVERALT